MRRAAVVLIGWGLWLALWTAAQIPFRNIAGPFGLHGIEALMLGTSAFACVLVGLVLWVQEARARAEPRARAISDESPSTAVLVTGLALSLVGAGFGLWLILIGAGVTFAGCAGLVNEALTRRRRGGAR